MKKIIVTALFLFMYVNSSLALSNLDVSLEVPDEFHVIEHWVSLTTSFDIETKTRKLGTLYRKFFSLLLTYEFFDPFDNKLATARSKFLSFSAHFDVYDNNDNLLGFAEEKIFTFFPTFDIFASDTVTKLARAEMNFWGTTFTIYDPLTDQEMAQMYRSFFRVKNDWTVRITNRPLFTQRNIDPRLLMTVLAFQGDRENWENYQNNNNNKNNKFKRSLNSSERTSELKPHQLNLLLEKIATTAKQEGLENIKNPDPKTLESIANELENNYKNTQINAELKQTQDKVNHFADYCLDLVHSDAVSDSKKKAILFLLKMRLGGETNLT